MKVLLIFTALTLCASISAQSIQWESTFGGTFQETTQKVLNTKDGGLLVGAITESNNVDVNGNHGDADIWLLKLNAGGTKQWQKCFGGLDLDAVTSMTEVETGGYIIAGNTDSNGDKNSNQVFGNHGFRDIWLIKTDDLGNIEWRKTFGGCDSDVPRGIIQTSDGNFCVVGGTLSHNTGDVYGAHGDWDAWVIKISAKGELLWQKTIGGTGIDYLYAVAETSNGDLVVGGFTTSSNGDLNGQNSKGNEDYWIAKLSANGDILWSKNYGGTLYDGVRGLCIAKNGDIVVTGVSFSNNGDVTGAHDDADIWVLRLNTDGNLIWQRAFGGSAAETGYSVFQRSDNNFIMVGETTSTGGDISGNHGGQDIWVVKFDGNGNLKNQKCLGGSGFDYARAAALGANDDIIVGGTSNSSDGDVSNHIGGNDTWIVRLSVPLGLTPETPNASGFEMTITPNPANDFLMVSTNLSGAKQVRIFSETGALVQTIDMNELKTTLQIGQLPAGIYVASMYAENGQVVSMRFVKE